MVENPREWGRYVESAIGAYLVSQAPAKDFKVYYWRDKNNGVDFVIERRQRVVAIEVKSGQRPMNEGLPLFNKTYNPHRAFVVGTGGISVEEFLTMDLDVLFR